MLSIADKYPCVSVPRGHMLWPLCTPMIGPCLYDQLFVSMERARWDLSRDIDFDAIEPARLTPRWIDTVREVCAFQLASLRASEMFLGGFRTDIDFCSFVSVWFYEEMEHTWCCASTWSILVRWWRRRSCRGSGSAPTSAGDRRSDPAVLGGAAAGTAVCGPRRHRPPSGCWAGSSPSSPR